MNTPGSKPGIGIIGCGSMGTALVKSIVNSDTTKNKYFLCAYAKNEDQKSAMNALGICCATDICDLISKSDFIIVAVRPEQVKSVVEDIVNSPSQAVRQNKKIIISLAAGITLPFLSSLIDERFDIARVMPNTLVSIGRGLFGLCFGSAISIENKQLVRELFGELGRVVEFEESKMNAFTALAGCGPGFLFYIMDSFAEAGVSVGLNRNDAQTIAISLMDGCTYLAESTGVHPALLREQGTSPAGMTIAGLNHLDCVGVRGHLIEAVKKTMAQGKIMDKEFCPEK